MREWQMLLSDRCTESMSFVDLFFHSDNLCNQFGPRLDCTFVQMILMLDLFFRVTLCVEFARSLCMNLTVIQLLIQYDWILIQ